MISVISAGLGAAAVVNELALLVNIKERLCRVPYCKRCYDTSVQLTTEYSAGTPVLKDSSVFVPITAIVSAITSGTCNRANTQTFKETFVVTFQGQTALPSSVTIENLGSIQDSDRCEASISDSITVTLVA